MPDIARGALILLVVWGHLIEKNGFNDSLYFSIYIFHIPAFAMIGGMFAKPKLNKKEALKIWRKLVIPLIVFQVLYFLLLKSFAPDRVSDILTPAWIVWFLFSLATWKFLLPLFLKLPFPFILSILAALMAGFIDEIGREFSLSRTFVFFPAFIFGHLYGKLILAAATQYRIPLTVLFITIICVAFLVSDHVDIRWLWGSQSYSRIPLETPGIVYRAVVIAIGIVASVAFLAVVPSRSQSLALIGRKTMPIYLFHGFPVVFFWASGFRSGSGYSFLLFTAILSLAISFSIAWGVGLISARSGRST